VRTVVEIQNNSDLTTVKDWILIAGKLQNFESVSLLGSLPFGIITLYSGGR
jgi:hypothetical protein